MPDPGFRRGDEQWNFFDTLYKPVWELSCLLLV
jgi:hypothetical protein